MNNELQFNEVMEFKYLGSTVTCNNMVRLIHDLQQAIDYIFLIEIFLNPL